MNKKKIADIIEKLNGDLVDEKATLEEVEGVIQSTIRHFLDNLTDISDIDYFQDRVNDMVDKYVDNHFEDSIEEGA